MASKIVTENSNNHELHLLCIMVAFWLMISISCLAKTMVCLDNKYPHPPCPKNGPLLVLWMVLHLDSPLPTSESHTTPRTHTGLTELGAPEPGDLPSAPTGVVAAIVSTRFVTLSWNMPEDTGSSEIVAYSVYWRETGSDR